MTASETQLLWAEFGDRLRGFIARRVANEADAEDILQEVFLRIHQRRDSVQHADRLGAWLFQVTRNAIADHYRGPARRRELVAGTTFELAVDQHDNAAHAVEAERESAQAQQELAACLRPMVKRLPAHYREAIVLVELEGLTQRDAAERLGLSVSGMKSRVQRGRRALKAMLQDCCRVHVDAGGRIIDYEGRIGSCTTCDDQGQGRSIRPSPRATRSPSCVTTSKENRRQPR